ncbi:MAG: N-acetylneuraminate synthase family protein [Bacteriovoracaceae bacterium]|nr:N-acetylneuraminate synthase family protein [Bacteroidota bacterium]
MKVKFVAEVSSNHNRDIERSKRFIHATAEAGCSGVKFQLFKIDQLFSHEILEKSLKHRKRKEWELPVSFIPELAKCAHDLGLEFSCTPFYLDAVDELSPYVDFYKIASYELLWKELFLKCGNTGKPLVFSTGMATIQEIEQAFDWITTTPCKDLIILKCTSSYPTPIAEANLQGIETLRKNFASRQNNVNVSFGWSDHTVSSAVIARAVHRYEVNFVEFHLDLDGKGEEFQSGHCWLPHQIKEVIKNVNDGFLADGSSDITPSESELPDREWRADPLDGLRPFKKLRATF